jgi:hypothetical protein
MLVEVKHDIEKLGEEFHGLRGKGNNRGGQSRTESGGDAPRLSSPENAPFYPKV